MLSTNVPNHNGTHVSQACGMHSTYFFASMRKHAFGTFWHACGMHVQACCMLAACLIDQACASMHLEPFCMLSACMSHACVCMSRACMSIPTFLHASCMLVCVHVTCLCMHAACLRMHVACLRMHVACLCKHSACLHKHTGTSGQDKVLHYKYWTPDAYNLKRQ